MATNAEGEKWLSESKQYIAEHPELISQEEVIMTTAEAIFQQLEAQGMSFDQLAQAVGSTPTTLRHALHLGMTNQLKGRIAAALHCRWKIDLVPRP